MIQYLLEIEKSLTDCHVQRLNGAVELSLVCFLLLAAIHVVSMECVFVIGLG